MIEYVSRSGEPEAMNCPAFICDACRKQVIGPGNILWAIRLGEDAERASSPLYVAHKGRCDQAVTALLEHLYPFDEGWHSNLWTEIEAFLGPLNNNAVHAFADDPDGTYHDHALIQPGGIILPTFASPKGELP
ncbi:hypothetical protein AB0B63_07315 [Micromonospora sp. NPDC049081]|uniref:hypothetical protein n=1 Tax=Micromonospora sp. NPDC049081 TaxID=3155150 RepID=UPI0033F549E0